MDNLILRAAQLAKKAHAGQKRKYHGRNYVEHPARVAARVLMIDGVTAEEVAAALLHDVLEDCDYTTDDLLAAGMPQQTVQLVEELTNPSKQPDVQGKPRTERKVIDRAHLASVSRQAKRIKLADMLDNLRDIGEAEAGFISLYVAEKVRLIEYLKSADPELAEDVLLAIDDLGYPRDHQDERVE